MIGEQQKLGVIFGIAFVGWALCAAVIGIGVSITSLWNALVIHAIGAPIIFAVLSGVYFGRFGFTAPLTTAVAFTGFVMAMDFFIVAMLIQRSLGMFGSMLGTWLPFLLIFSSTYLTGSYVAERRRH